MRKRRLSVIALCAVMVLNTLSSMTVFAAQSDVTAFTDKVDEIKNEIISAKNYTDVLDAIQDAETLYNALTADEQKDAAVKSGKDFITETKTSINKVIPSAANSTVDFPIETITFSFNSTVDTLTKEDASGKVTIFKDTPVEFINHYKKSISLDDDAVYKTVPELPFKHIQGKFGYEFPSFTDMWDSMTLQEFYIKNDLSGADDGKLDPTDPDYDDTLVAPTGTIGKPLAGWQLEGIKIDGELYTETDTFFPADTIGRGHEIEYIYVPSYTYTLNYDLSGGTSTSYKSATKASILANDKWHVVIEKNADGSFKNPPVKAGNTFTGFKLDGEDTLYTDTFDLQMQSGKARTLRAIWEPDTVTVNKWTASIIYDGNIPGQANIKTIDIEVDEANDSYTFTLLDNAWDYTDHKFLGWTLTKGGAADYAPNETITVTKDASTIRLYAVWQDTATNPDAWTASVTYNANVQGSTEQPKSENVAVNTGSTTTLKAAANSFKNEGYNFKAWNTKADGTGTSYAVGNDISITKDAPRVVLYAIWEKAPETWEAKLVYSLNGGNGSIAIDTASVTGESHEFTVKKPDGISRDGFTFTGWNTKADGTGSSYAADSKLTVTKGAPSNELFAQWKEVVSWRATIKYNANGGSGSIADQTVDVKDKEKETITIKGIENMNNSGNTFLSWNTKADGSGTTYAANSTWEAKKDAPTLELYAQWKKIDPWKAVVKYDLNGGTGTVADTSVDVTNADKQEVTLAKSDGVTREGFTFKEWNTKADGTGTAYKTESKLTVFMAQPTVTVYAIWQSPTADANKNTTNSTGSGNASNVTPVPKTADDTNLALYAVLILLGLAGMASMAGWEIMATGKKK